MQNVEKMLLRDAQDAKINGTVLGNVNLDNGRVINHYVTLFLVTNKRIVRNRKKSNQSKKKKHSLRH